MNIINLLFRRPRTESDVRLPKARYANRIDEFKLCKQCQFTGRCTIKGGCSAFHVVTNNRRNKIDEIRGVDRTEHVAAGEFKYLNGLCWKHYPGVEDADRDKVYDICRIVRVEGTTAYVKIERTAVAKDYAGKHRGNGAMPVIAVKISYEVSAYGRYIADMAGIKSNVKKGIQKEFKL